MATLTPTVQQVLSNLFLEILNGELSDETIAAVDRLQRDDVPQPMWEVVNYMHGMSTHPPLRYAVTTDVIRILAGELFEMVEMRHQGAPPIE